MSGFLAGAIVAKLILDKTGWNASVDGVKADEKTLTGSAKNIDQAFTALGTRMAATGGIMVAAVIGVTQKTAVAEERMGDLAKSVGIGIEKFTALTLTAELGMISLEEMGASLGILSRNMADAVGGSVQAQDKFGLLGITTKDLTDGKGGLKDTDQVLMIIADRFKEMPDGPAKVAAAMELMGRGGKAMIPVLNDGSGAIKQQMERTRELGGVMTKDGIRSAEDYVRAQKEMKISMDATTRSLGEQLMPLVTDFMKKATDIATAVRNWAKEHPALAKTVMETALGLGSMALGMGTALMMLPQLIKGLEAMKTVAGAGGVGGALTKIGAVAATAFVGWQIGRAIGELTGLDEWLQKTYDKAFKLLGIIKEHSVEYGSGHAAAYGKQQEAIGKAFELTGKHAKNYHEALDLLVEVYKKNKTTGSESLDALVKAHGAANEAVEKHSFQIIDNKKAAEEAKKVQEEWAAFLSSVGIQSQEDMSKAHEFCRKAASFLEEQYKTGKIGTIEYTEAHKKLNEKMWETGTMIATILPPSRDMHDVWGKMPGQIESASYEFGSLDDKLESVAHEMGISVSTLKAYQYELARIQLGIMGFTLPPFPGWPKDEIKTAVTDPVSEAFAGLYNNIAQGFGDTFQKFIETWSVDKLLKMDIDFKAFFKDLWGNIKESFFTMIGELATKWVKGFLEDILVKKTAEAATSVGTSMTKVATAMTGVGTIITTIATTIATVITTLATAIATAIGTIAVGLATALVTLATGIATAATILAAAAVPLLIVGAIAIAIFAGFKAIEALFGGGGGKQTDVTYWLKLMWADGKEVHDWIINLPAAYFNTWHNFFFNTEWATRETVTVLYAIKDFLGPMLSALQSIDNQIANLKTAQSGAISTQTEMLIVHGTPSIPEITMPLPGLKTLIAEGGPRNGNGGGAVIFQADFNVQTLDADSFRETVRSKIGPEIVEWIKTNVGKRLLADALGV
jgi:urease accessory protein UreF